MKKFVILIALVFFPLVSCFAASDMQKQEPAAPLNVATAPAKEDNKTIFSYKSELGLNEKQVGDINKLFLGLQNNFIEKGKKLNALRQELNEMVKSKGDLKAIHRKIEEISKIQVENTYADIETSRKIENILTSVQLSNWHAIQKAVREKMLAAAKLKASQETDVANSKASQ